MMAASERKTSPQPSASPMRILFMDKVFLKPCRQEPLRGVEVFNLMLLRDLHRLGYAVWAVGLACWRELLAGKLKADCPQWLEAPPAGVDFLNGVVAGLRRTLPPADVLLLGNVGRSLVPLVQLLRRRGRIRSCVVIAHREASPGFVRLIARLPGHVIAVNEVIARPFREAGHPRVVVDYGVADADRFHPPEVPRAPDGPTHFVVMGMLDNAWKGADTAIEAFRRLPGPIRARARLHLASYRSPPAIGDPGIQAHLWMPAEEIPGFLRGMDVLLAPSRDEGVMRETFSQAVVQGMLTGLPVLVSDLAILREKVEAGGGWVARDADELSRHMAELAGDPALRKRLGDAARAIALQRYVWDTARFARRYLEGSRDAG